ncbi:MAG: hypothetical protein KJN79_02660, partial [Gammaproteobacteria bacterium]|nr:hypothetical protein [Gammaproteobacteria bacterium]
MACPTENLRSAFSEAILTGGEAGGVPKGLSSTLVVDNDPGILGSLQKGLAAQFSLIETASD